MQRLSEGDEQVLAALVLAYLLVGAVMAIALQQWRWLLIWPWLMMQAFLQVCPKGW